MQSQTILIAGRYTYILLMDRVPLLKPLAWLLGMPVIRPLLARLLSLDSYPSSSEERAALSGAEGKSRLRRWRALVRKREPIVVEHEPTA